MADMEVTKKVYSADEIQVILGIGRRPAMKSQP